MPQATARDTASAFRKKPVQFAPQPWSGRVDPDECHRPGGLLTAALMQCASERDLSQSDLATSLGVSYWDVSQLRIGFRPIESIKDELAEACAVFLGVPRLTVDMLAGLLDPQDALASAPLTGEDIVHARHLQGRDAAHVALDLQHNRARALQALSVDELAELQRAWGGNPAVRQALSAELRHRPMSKTELLRAAVGTGEHTGATPQQAPDGASPHAQPATAIIRCTCCQKRLRIPLMDSPSDIRCPACQTEYAVHWQEMVCVVQRHEAPADDDTVDAGADPAPEVQSAPAADPWGVLGLAHDSPWAEVERARRMLLQQYHPDRLGHVPPLVHKLAEDAFKRVNDAYDALKAQR